MSNYKSGAGEEMYSWMVDLFPICRSLTGPGVRETLDYLKKLLPDIKIQSVTSGTKAFDWDVPDEWTIRDAYVEDDKGNRVIDFKLNNLHVVGYSEPIDEWMDFKQLDLKLYSLPGQPAAIPYITSYYMRDWGFCLSHEHRVSLKEGMYHVVIDSEIKPGVLNYGELVIPGETTDEIFLSTYICHPSMANNELSGPVVTTALARWLSSLECRRYTYRIVFIPETIGSIVYLSQNLEMLKKNTSAGFVITCVGDNRAYSYLPSRKGDTLADRAAKHVLKHAVKEYDTYSYLKRGSDERQYCSPGVDLPVCSIMRSKYGTYPEYHTSLDDLSLVSSDGLEGAYNVLKSTIDLLEENNNYVVTYPCEPQLGKRGLYPSISSKSSAAEIYTKMNILAYADGDRDLIELADTIGEYVHDILDIINKFTELGLLRIAK
jgi:aminopeptidase-like protein